jgi:four helix bundle protein
LSSWLRRTPRENGFERRTKKDFAHFLDLAKGSAGEVRSMLYLGEDRSYITAKIAEPLRDECKDLSKSIGALAASLRRGQ